jgi:DnaJ-class molecular chaperone
LGFGVLLLAPNPILAQPPHPRYIPPVSSNPVDHYATLGLNSDCTEADIRAAYRLLAKEHHPDRNGHSVAAHQRTQALNAAYEILSDRESRQAYDASRRVAKPTTSTRNSSQRTLAQDVLLPLIDFLRGTRLEIRVTDPATPGATEVYELAVPPETAPGAKFRVPRTSNPAGGVVIARLKPRPDPRFKVRGNDVRCDLRISAARATQGGVELVRDILGNSVRVTIPRNVARGELIRIAAAGLPRARGGRGDLIVRIQYRTEVKIRRAGR